MTDKNPYDTSIDWLAPQSPASRQESRYTSPDQHVSNYYQAEEQVPTQPLKKKAASTKQARMPKQRALELVDSLKKGIIISSVVSFGVLGLLATGHAVGTTTSITKTSTPVTSSKSSSSSSTTPSSSSSSTTPSSSSSSNSSSSSGNTSSSTSQGGFSFGSSSSQSSVSGSHVS